MPKHSEQTGHDAVHPTAFKSATDPATTYGADKIGAEKPWYDTTAGTHLANGWVWKIRNSGNTAWDVLLDLATALALKMDASTRGAANGVASLDSGGLVPTAQLPPLAINETSVVASQSAMLALTAQRGDIAIRTDVNKTFVLSSDTPATLADWKEIITPTSGGVTSFDGRTGAVSPASGDYALADITGLATALAGKLAASNNLSDVASASTARTNLDVYSTSQVDSAVNSAAAGNSWKTSVRAKTTANVSLSGGGIAAGTAHDGVTLATGDRVLVGSQTSAAENGIYIVPTSGAASRSTDADSAAEIRQASVYVEEGTANADTQWVLTTNAPITLGTTALTFTQFNTGSGEANTASNLGSGNARVFSGKVGVDLQFRRLKAGTNITLTENTNDVTIDASGGSPARATVTKTTASLVADATETGTVTLAKSGLFFTVTADRGAWVRVYATAADVTADASRSLGTAASATTNILAEWSFAAAGSIRRLSVPYYNGDGSPTATLYYAITNKSGATHAVQIDFTHLALES